MADTFSKYDGTVSTNDAKMAKGMTAQMKPHIFEPFKPSPILGFLKNFKLNCDTNGIYEGAAMWLILFFMKQ